ncbi:MAG: ABC-2 family transporter protein [Candidatus Moranbacteria bacterium]|nr:ABC-2 family transporter protein [Candidatus Moranbacteria bacterium]
MKKYLTVFKISWARELEYRLAFFLGRSRNIIFLLLLYYVWLSLSRMTGRFAMYSADELAAYVFGAHLLRSVVFGSQTREIAWDINNGNFSNYLTHPVSHFWYMFWLQAAQRALYFLSAIFELVIFVFITKAHFFRQTQWQLLLVSILATVLASFLYFILTYVVSLSAFWSREAMGPRFLFEWILEFSSGSFFPLDILSKNLLAVFQFLPFAYLIYFPLKIYLGGWNAGQIAGGIGIQAVFIFVFAALARVVLKRGLMRYSGEGI